MGEKEGGAGEEASRRKGSRAAKIGLRLVEELQGVESTTARDNQQGEAGHGTVWFSTICRGEAPEAAAGRKLEEGGQQEGRRQQRQSGDGRGRHAEVREPARQP